MAVCDAPITQGPNAGQPATGTLAGAARHRRRGEEPCPKCLKAVRDYDRVRATEQRRARQIPKDTRSTPRNFPGHGVLRCVLCERPYVEHPLGPPCPFPVKTPVTADVRVDSSVG